MNEGKLHLYHKAGLPRCDRTTKDNERVLWSLGQRQFP